MEKGTERYRVRKRVIKREGEREKREREKDTERYRVRKGDRLKNERGRR